MVAVGGSLTALTVMPALSVAVEKALLPPLVAVFQAYLDSPVLHPEH